MMSVIRSYVNLKCYDSMSSDGDALSEQEWLKMKRLARGFVLLRLTVLPLENDLPSV